MGKFINADALGGQVGELLSHNVFAYCQNNVVNMGDPSGFMMVCITDGCGGCYNPPAKDDFVIPSSNSTISGIIDTAAGVAENYNESIPWKVTASGTLGNGPKVISPSSIDPTIVTPYASIAKKVSNGALVISTVLDIGHILTDNSLTKRQKEWRTVGFVLAIGVGFVAGAFIAPIFAAGAATTGLASVGYWALGAVLTLESGSLISKGQEKWNSLR